MSSKPVNVLHEKVDCPISGQLDSAWTIPLVPEKICEGEEHEVAQLEWTWGLSRGGLRNYVASKYNNLIMRPDIAHMFARAEFILAPTFRTYTDTMKFAKHAGVINRDEKDLSMRRPLTGLSTPDGLFRYVFIPFTDDARALLNEVGMRPQTEDDMNGGIHPIRHKPLHAGSDQYPVVECSVHPYSVCHFAERAFEVHGFGTHITAQWALCASFVLTQWEMARVAAPQWFLHAPKTDCYDYPVYGSEKSGYTRPLTNPLVRTPANPDEIFRMEQHPVFQEHRQKVLQWFPKLKPAKKDSLAASRSPFKPRRSERLAKLASPYTSLPTTPRRRRKASPAAREYDRCPAEEGMPAWLQQNGHFPTELFSSNDWAFFYCGTSLDGKLGKVRERHSARPLTVIARPIAG
ncbi:hypothetical protein HDZ31DRAFT_32444 [Schizophyllum fasciatum]